MEHPFEIYRCRTSLIAFVIFIYFIRFRCSFLPVKERTSLEITVSLWILAFQLHFGKQKMDCNLILLRFMLCSTEKKNNRKTAFIRHYFAFLRFFFIRSPIFFLFVLSFFFFQFSDEPVQQFRNFFSLVFGSTKFDVPIKYSVCGLWTLSSQYFGCRFFLVHSSLLPFSFIFCFAFSWTEYSNVSIFFFFFYFPFLFKGNHMFLFIFFFFSFGFCSKLIKNFEMYVQKYNHQLDL